MPYHQFESLSPHTPLQRESPSLDAGLCTLKAGHRQRWDCSRV